MQPIREQHELPALIGAIVDDRGLRAIGVVGVRRHNAPEPATVHDLFHIGSCTKAITATLAARLVERGVIRWDSTVGEVLGGPGSGIHPEWNGVTLEQLLMNRSGAAAAVPDALWTTLWAFEGTAGEARRALADAEIARKPVAPPGTKMIYSNTGFAIAGVMLEMAAGRDWEALMQEEVFTPLGIRTAGHGAPGTPETVDQPRGHYLKSGKLTAVRPGPRADNPPAIGPAGRVHCSMPDWARFVAAHLRGARLARGLSPRESDGANGEFLKPETFGRLHTAPPGGDYAMGWVRATRPWGGEVFWHNGSNTLWYAVTWVAPEKNIAVLVCTNSGAPAANAATDAAAEALIRHALGLAPQTPTPD
ncbi:MAG: beta-lactamase family protein [Phycisphaerales bacterium]|nr:beta-lactamase family protein [Phycisphaerales bacterium]